jgi:APA family basic amino acid/polyamine antiporter
MGTGGSISHPDSASPLSDQPELRRIIGVPYASAMVIGTIIGASIFVQPSEITGQVPSIAGVLLVWAVAGILTLFGALVCAELASIYTDSGGVYVFLREAFSPALGFLWGWAMLWVMHSGIIAAIAVVFARYTGFFVPLGDAGTRALAVGVILVLSTVNYFGVRQGAGLQASFTWGKLMAIAGMIVLGLAFGHRVPEHFAGGQPFLETTGPREFGLALMAGLFAFGGWHMVTYNAGETRDPGRTIPRALVLGTIVVTLCYIGLNAAYLYVLPLDQVAASTRVAADAADVLFGFGGGAMMAGLVMFSTFGAVSGIILAGPRVYYAMARDGLLFAAFGEPHPRFRTPHRAIVLQAAVASVLVLTGTYSELFTRVIYTEWIFFGLLGVALVLLRRRGDVRREYRIWGYPFVPLTFAAAAFAIVANQLWADPVESLTGLSIVLAGLPVYWVWVRRRPSGGPVTIVE